MSSLPRILRHLPATRRPYSSFFSSKSGGGRYFNSAKHQKPAVVAPSNNDSKTPADTQDPTASQPDPPQSVPSNHSFLPPHPTINAKEFRLHQFFALHRPLLLISDPASILQPAPAKGPLYSSSTVTEDPLPPPPPIGKYGKVLDDLHTFSPDADAETARQLMRSLTMNRVGAAAAWQETLKRLGLTLEMDSHTIEQMKQDWNHVWMDSTKRKRRKKMKKHKLKKRRRATRATRLKIGR